MKAVLLCIAVSFLICQVTVAEPLVAECSTQLPSPRSGFTWVDMTSVGESYYPPGQYLVGGAQVWAEVDGIWSGPYYTCPYTANVWLGFADYSGYVTICFIGCNEHPNFYKVFYITNQGYINGGKAVMCSSNETQPYEYYQGP